MKNFTIALFFLLSFNSIKSQETILCSSLRLELKIENTSDIPTVNPNNDGTINLSFPQEYITDIFANYEISDFVQSFPTSSEELQKYYSVYVNSKGIIESIASQVPSSVMVIFDNNFSDTTLPINLPIETELIQFLNGNSFDVIKYRTTSESDNCFDCPLIDVPENFNFRIHFNYDAVNDILLLESANETSCGNSLSIGLKGGSPNGFTDADNILQLWEYYSTNPASVNLNESCAFIEGTIFEVLDIACSFYDDGYDNTFYTIDSESETFQLTREHMLFGNHTIELSKASLSVKDDIFSQLKPYKSKENPYLQIANLDNEVVSVGIYNTLGQPVIYAKHFKNNNVNVSTLDTGIYFIKISNSLNQEKVFKYIF